MDEMSTLDLMFRAVQASNASFKFLCTLITFAHIHRRQQNAHTQRRKRIFKKYNVKFKVTRQLEHIRDLTLFSDETCINHLRMSRDTFSRLCYLLEHVGGLESTRHVTITEQVAIFLSIISHHKKNRVVKDNFFRSGHTISKHFNCVLKSLLSLHTILLVQPTPISEDEQTDRWKYFKGCLGALDGTYIPVKVPIGEKPRYRNRKGFVSVNVLAVCDRKMNYVYVLTGWEGSAADGRVLRDAISRPHGLRVPLGQYYLVDGGYTNGPGFLAPYRGVRYHLQEWHHASREPETPHEYFNLMHARARNVIERSFGILKARWGILRSNSFYPIKTQNHIILACCLLHNFIRTHATIDPLENEVPDLFPDPDFEPPMQQQYVEHVESSQEWSDERESIVQAMWTNRHSAT